MLKFLTHKLRTHSINEDHYMEKADEDHDSGTESDEEIDGQDLPQAVLPDRPTTVSPADTGCSLESPPPDDRHADAHSSEEELEGINGGCRLPPRALRSASSLGLAEKRKWSQVGDASSRRYTPENEENMSHYGNLSPSSPCSPYLKCYGEDGIHIEHSGSSDDEVHHLLTTRATPVQFRTSPPLEAVKPERRSVPCHKARTTSPPPKLLHYEVSPRKRTKHARHAHIQRPYLDFEKMQQDSSEFYHYYAEKKPNIQIPYRNPQKIQKGMPVFNYVSERKCPIYVHDFKKISTGSTSNNYSSKTLGNNMLNPASKSPPSSRSMIDRLEETYWATWKPSKDRNRSKSSRRYTEKNGSSRNKAYGDVSDTFVKYFAKTDFDTSKASVMVESDNYETINESDAEYGHFIEMNSQEIQTEEIPNNVQNVSNCKAAVEGKEIETEQLENPSVEKNDTVPEKESVENTEANNPTEEENNENPTIKDPFSKILNHTDSFILMKKKQSVVKETYQQPKCIKLYRKPGSSYARGGTYPLKSCLRKETSTTKGNFRLGPPGSPLFVTSNSFNRKFGI